MLLAHGSSSASGEVQGIPAPLKIAPRAAVTGCLPNSRLGLFLLEKSKLEKLVVTRNAGRELGFPSGCSARIASKLFDSVELPVELTQLPSVQTIWSSRYRLLPRPDTGLILCLQSFSWTLEPFFESPKTIKWVHLEYTGQKYQRQIKSGLQRTHKNTVFRD